MTEKLKSGHTVEHVTGEEAERLKRYFAFSDGAIRLQPGNWLYPKAFLRYADLIYSFKVRPTDIFVATYPKSGTTWMQEIVWNLVHNPTGDNPAASLSIDARFPNFEADMFLALPGVPPPKPDGDPMKAFQMLCPGMDPSDGFLVHLAAFSPKPRLQKNHLGLPLLPPDTLEKSKVIYVARDPRDVIVSYFYYAQLHNLWSYKGSFEDFVDDFINDRMVFGSYFEHMKAGWENRNHPNFLLIYFEDLKADAKTEIQKVDKFIGTKRTVEQIKNIVDLTSFGKMKESSEGNPPTSNDKLFFDKEVEKKTGGFYRKGNVGSWKEEFTPELKAKVEAWITKNGVQFGEDFRYKI